MENHIQEPTSSPLKTLAIRFFGEDEDIFKGQEQNILNHTIGCDFEIRKFFQIIKLKRYQKKCFPVTHFINLYMEKRTNWKEDSENEEHDRKNSQQLRW